MPSAPDLSLPENPGPAPLILASGSASRLALLRAARVPVEAVPASVDEAAIKAALLADGASARDVADALAEFKARRIAARLPGCLVLGADQVLVCDGKLYDKPASLADARRDLEALRGRRHELLSAAVVFENGAPVWRHVGRAQRLMRPFTDAFLDAYLNEEGEALLTTVGAYRIEDGGARLFARVYGDIFTIMGLPLLELLEFLRTRGVSPS